MGIIETLAEAFQISVVIDGVVIELLSAAGITSVINEVA